MKRSTVLFAAGFGIASLAGCSTTRSTAERFGKTYYLDGAGNWGFGVEEVAGGLKQAGYRGDVEVFVWTMTFIPLADQLNYYGAQARAAELARKICDYRRRYPQNDVNIIALSAGSGVATWAVEMLPLGVKMNNLVLLGSSLSHNYDMRLALNHMTGKIYTYYSPYDKFLKTLKVVGTIDQKRGVDAIGQVGLTPPRGYEDRVVNTGWSRKWYKLGWTGGHTDCTNRLFVRREIAPRLFSTESPQAEAMSETRDDSATSVSAVSH